MTDKQLQKLCTKWQRRLHLQDWVVVFRSCRHYEMQPGCSGHCEMTLKRKEALITILCEEDRFPTGFCTSMERDLVHELLHLHLEPVWDDSKELELEQAINAIARALTPDEPHFVG